MIRCISDKKKKRMFAGVLPLVLLAVAAAMVVAIGAGQVGSAKACDYGGCGLGFYHHWGFSGYHWRFYHWGLVGGGCCNNNNGPCCDSQGSVFQSVYNPWNQYQQYQPQSQGQNQGQTANVNVEGNNNYVSVNQGQHQEQSQSTGGSPLDNQCWSGEGWGQCGGPGEDP